MDIIDILVKIYITIYLLPELYTPRVYHGDSLNVMLSRFPKQFLPFPIVFLGVSSSAFTVSVGASPISPECFPCLLFQIL